MHPGDLPEGCTWPESQARTPEDLTLCASDLTSTLRILIHPVSSVEGFLIPGQFVDLLVSYDHGGKRFVRRISCASFVTSFGPLRCSDRIEARSTIVPIAVSLRMRGFEEQLYQNYANDPQSRFSLMLEGTEKDACSNRRECTKELQSFKQPENLPTPSPSRPELEMNGSSYTLRNGRLTKNPGANGSQRATK